MQRTVRKPWGEYTDYYRDDRVVFKTIKVDPGKRLSLQDHHRRDELWLCLEGEGIASLDDQDIQLTPGTHVMIRKNQLHRLSNPSEEPLIIAEMQFGWCNEDDIRRHEDDFGRIFEGFT